MIGGILNSSSYVIVFHLKILIIGDQTCSFFRRLLLLVVILVVVIVKTAAVVVIVENAAVVVVFTALVNQIVNKIHKHYFVGIKIRENFKCRVFLQLFSVLRVNFDDAICNNFCNGNNSHCFLQSLKFQISRRII